MSFTIEENTNPDVVEASIDRGGNILLDYADVLDSPLYRFQNSELLGTYLFVTEGERQSVIDNFPIFEEEGLAFNITSSPEGDIVTGEAQITVKATNLLGDSVTDTLQVSVTEESLEDIEPIVDELTAFNRFRNVNVAGTYIYATEEESQSIRQNFADVFVEEGLAFYAFGAGSNQGEDVFRFRNRNVPGTYVFVTAEEASSIRQNFADVFVEEGVAFEVL